MRHYCSPDLIPDHPIAILFGILGVSLGQLLDVSGSLVVAAVILFALNVAASIVITVKEEKELNGELIEGTFLRLFAYSAGGVGVIVFSNMGSVPGKPLRDAAFQGIAGVELLFLFATLARISKRFRPIYLWMQSKLDSILPFDFGSTEVRSILEDYKDQEGSSSSG